MAYKNFTSWPLNQYTNDGVNVVVSPQDMTTEVNTKIQDKQVFRFGGLFADDCRFGCGDMPSKLAANGKGKFWDTLNTGLNLFSQTQQSEADRVAAEKAAEIARLNLQTEKEKTEQAGVLNKYRVPLAIGAAVVLAGLTAYLVYKAKK